MERHRRVFGRHWTLVFVDDATSALMELLFCELDYTLECVGAANANNTTSGVQVGTEYNQQVSLVQHRANGTFGKNSILRECRMLRLLLVLSLGLIVSIAPGLAAGSEEAPSEVIGINPGRDHDTDHRGSSSGGSNVTDHRAGTTDHRKQADEPRSNEVVPARRGTPGGTKRPDTAPVGLDAPSDLDTSDVTGRTAVIHWMDNSTREWGVELYRMVAARRGDPVRWQFVGNFEERNDSRVTGTGLRSDQDSDLTPETNYCYRLRAYVGFDKSERSNFSAITCTSTTR